ncbi:CPC_1213 family protein [Clostridium sp. CX1]|uniref:CPC_1213 family protein n=1 Tax=Clostridium tanneri TaxID=3037988 RepID=A0ABU4JPJ6_9CLOT|nr:MULTISPECIES: CPC_1213 family protein [unclassified Clostridium]MCT8977160.1 CPC_1213 family protein [Clostridium sp. CX1]MDW8799904.1 CPC_1213 family protein [Clostridium sp. A1-XYC3]
MTNKMKYTQNNKKSDGRFRKRHIDHTPQDESSRAKFGTYSEKHLD